jgi:hypothetical protein
MPVITLSVTDETELRIQSLSKNTKRTRSAIVDMAVELLAQQEEFTNLTPPAPPKNKPGTRTTPTPRHPFDPTSIKGVRRGLPITVEAS